MKVTLLGLLMAFARLLTYGQGTVLFNNGTGIVHTWKASEDGVMVPAPVNSYVQLAFAPVGVGLHAWTGLQTEAEWLAANPGWTLGPAVALNSPGKFNGGTVTLDGVLAGEQAQYFLFAWRYGSSFDDALVTGWLGMSVAFTTDTGGVASGHPEPVPLANSFGGMWYPSTIPEPSLLSLLVVGLACGSRRRKRITKPSAA